MGRPKALQSDDDISALLDMLETGVPKHEIADTLGVSAPTLRKRIQDMRDKEGIILEYRSLQSLELTALQARILSSITTEKIEEAPLDILVKAYKILKDKETDIEEGRVGEVKGLVGYLIELEKREAAVRQKELELPEGTMIDVTPEKAADRTKELVSSLFPKVD